MNKKIPNTILYIIITIIAAYLGLQFSEVFQRSGVNPY